jgi:hypothetical protein
LAVSRYLLAPCAALLAGAALAAPMPLPKPPPPRHVAALRPADLRGAWTMDWQNEAWQTTFAADGSYRCERGGRAFVGWWALTDGQLGITEAHVGPGENHLDLPAGRWVTWVLPFRRDGRGLFDRLDLAGQTTYSRSGPIEVRLRRAAGK